MARRRLGAALLLPSPVGEEVDGLRRALGDPAFDRMRPHLTLVPPVNVAERDLDAALGLLRVAAAEASPVELTLGPPSSFLPVTPVLYLEVAGATAELGGLRRRLWRWPLERTVTHPFVPHVTLADRLEEGRIEAALANLDHYRIDVRIDRAHLLEEVRDDEGRRVWVPLADAELGLPAVVGRGGLALELSAVSIAAPDVVAFGESGGAALDSACDLLVVGRREGAVVGVAAGRTYRPTAEIAGVLVGAEHRRQGIGRHLLAALVERLLARGAERIVAHDIASGTPLAALYEATGWGHDDRQRSWRT